MNQKTPRPSWDEYFTAVAGVVSTRSTCPRAQVGTVIVRDNRILTTGYNGSPPGIAHCDELGCLVVNEHCIRTTHSETNAVVQAALHGISLAESTAYVTHEPCVYCTKILITAGIRHIIYTQEYPDVHARALRESANIQTKHIVIKG